MSGRILVEAVTCRMPAPPPSDAATLDVFFNYLVVLIEDRGRVAAKRGGGTDPQWVADHGETLPFDLARVYFPDLGLSLDATSRQYVAA